MPIIEDTTLSVRMKFPDGQELSLWVWDEKDRARAREWAEAISDEVFWSPYGEEADE